MENVGEVPTKWIEGYPRHFDAPPREPGSVEKRTDFMYMDGHGTFYKFDKTHYDESFLHAQKGDQINLVLYNLNTEQLDEITFELTSYEKIGKKYLYVNGFIADSAEYFQFKIEFFLPEPLESYIEVIASAKPYHSFRQHKPH